VFPQLIGADELLPTNVTRERSTFTVRLQQMRLELITPSEAFRAVSTRVRLGVRVDENVPLQLFAPLEQLPALKTLARSTAGVYVTLVMAQVVGSRETLSTQRASEWSVSGVHLHVTPQTGRLTERLVAQIARVQPASAAVSSAVFGDVARRRESLVALGAVDRFLCAMDSAPLHAAVSAALAGASVSTTCTRSLVYSQMCAHVAPISFQLDRKRLRFINAVRFYRSPCISIIVNLLHVLPSITQQTMDS